MDPQSISTGRRKNKYNQAFGCYRGLQSESYEFITRIIAVHNWLEDAYRILLEKPELDAGQLEAQWRPIYTRIYRQAFAPFLRANRVLIFPYGEMLKAQYESFLPREIAESLTSTLKLWGGEYTKFLSGIAGILRPDEEKPGQSEPAGQDAMDTVAGLSPVGLLGKMTGDEANHYFEAVARFLGCFGENQFLFPKAYIVNLQKVVTTYPSLYQQLQAYETMFWDTWESAMKEFARQAKANEAYADFKMFFDSYRCLLAEKFDELLKNPRFIRAQSDFIETSSDLVVATREMMESQLSMFPFLPFATNKETDAIARNVHSYKKRMDSMERKLRDYAGLKEKAARVDSLEEKVRNLEQALDKIGHNGHKPPGHAVITDITPIRIAEYENVL